METTYLPTSFKHATIVTIMYNAKILKNCMFDQH